MLPTVLLLFCDATHSYATTCVLLAIPRVLSSSCHQLSTYILDLLMTQMPLLQKGLGFEVC